MGRRLLWISVILVLTGAVNARAALMTAAREAQLEAWLNQGDLEFTNIFTKQVGSDSADFHAAVDGDGSTITLMQVASIEGRTAAEPGVGNVLGGYNPQSWKSNGSNNLSPLNGDRTAFIFNLDTAVKLAQRLNGYGLAQTYNHINWGPSFGQSAVGTQIFDLTTSSDLTTGSVMQNAYGPPTNGNGFYRGTNLLGDSFNSHRTGADGGLTEVTFGALEAYTFSPAAATSATAPEPGSLAILGVLGLAACGHHRRRRARPGISVQASSA